MSMNRSDEGSTTISRGVINHYFMKEEAKNNHHRRQVSKDSIEEHKRNSQKHITKLTHSNSFHKIGVNDKFVSKDLSAKPSNNERVEHPHKQRRVYLNAFPVIFKHHETSGNKKNPLERPEFDNSLKIQVKYPPANRIHIGSPTKLLSKQTSPHASQPHISLPVKSSDYLSIQSLKWNPPKSLYYFYQLSQFLSLSTFPTDRQIHYLDLIDAFHRRNEIEAVRPPKITPINKSRDKLLVLDIDETLVSCSKEKKRGPNLISKPVSVSLGGLETKVVAAHQMFVTLRPMLQEFLQKVTQHYDVVLFTTALQEYGLEVQELINADGSLIKGVFSREHCVLSKRQVRFAHPDAHQESEDVPELRAQKHAHRRQHPDRLLFSLRHRSPHHTFLRRRPRQGARDPRRVLGGYLRIGRPREKQQRVLQVRSSE